MFENSTKIEQYIARLKARPAYQRADQICKKRIEQTKQD